MGRTNPKCWETSQGMVASSEGLLAIMLAAEGREGDHPWWLWPSEGAESLGSSGHRAGQTGLETESKETAAVFSCCTGTLWTAKITPWKYGNVLFTPQCSSKALSVLLNTCAERWKLDFFFSETPAGKWNFIPCTLYFKGSEAFEGRCVQVARLHFELLLVL